MNRFSPELPEQSKKDGNAGSTDDTKLLKDTPELPVILMLLEVTANSDQKKAAHELVCYGLEEIARTHKVVGPKRSKKFFTEVKIEKLNRPEKIELLISHREGRLNLQRVKVIGDLVLWGSPLGKTVGGAQSDLFEEVEISAFESKFSQSMRTAAAKYQKIVWEASDEEPKTVTDITTTSAAHHEFLEWWR